MQIIPFLVQALDDKPAEHAPRSLAGVEARNSYQRALNKMTYVVFCLRELEAYAEARQKD